MHALMGIRLPSACSAAQRPDDWVFRSQPQGVGCLGFFQALPCPVAAAQTEGKDVGTEAAEPTSEPGPLWFSVTDPPPNKFLSLELIPDVTPSGGPASVCLEETLDKPQPGVHCGHSLACGGWRRRSCVLSSTLGPYPWQMQVPRLGVESEL